MDLNVDETLDETNSNLKAIHDEFENTQENRDDDREIWGQNDVRDAMAEFVDNWKAHREKMTKRLKTLNERVDQACKTWSETEKNLVEELDKFEITESSGA